MMSGGSEICSTSQCLGRFGSMDSDGGSDEFFGVVCTSAIAVSVDNPIQGLFSGYEASQN